MALIVGRAKSWAWWLAGLVCALLFGPRAQAGPEVAGGTLLPAAAPEKAETPAEQAARLVEDYLSPPASAEPKEEAAREIAKLIREFAAGDWGVRDAASQAIVKHGAAAIGALRAALKSQDPEVANRAEVALATIEATLRQTKGDAIVALYKRWGGPVLDVVTRKYVELRQASAKAAAAALEAEKAGKAEETEKARAEARAAREREAVAAGLYRRISPPPIAPPYGMLRRIALATPRTSRGRV